MNHEPRTQMAVSRANPQSNTQGMMKGNMFYKEPIPEVIDPTSKGFSEPSSEMIKFLHAYEGQNQTSEQLHTVRDLGDGVLTVGYGSTDKRWPDLKLGDVLTTKQIEDMFRSDLEWAVKEARKVTKDVKGIDQGKFDAIVSFIYNTGGGQSPKAMKALARGDFDKFAFEAFSPQAGVVKDEGVKSAGLINRRQDEQAIFYGTDTAYQTMNRDSGFGTKWLDKNKIG